MSEGGYWTIVILMRPLKRGLTSCGASQMESHILNEFPTVRSHKIPPVELEDPLAGTSVSGSAKLERSISMNR